MGSLKDWPFAGFPGTAVNPRTLQAEVVDEEACAAALELSTDPADAGFVLLVRGQAAQAAELVAQARLSDPASLRLQLLDADILRATRNLDAARTVLKTLLPDVAGTAAEPLVHHQLGTVHFAGGDYPAAVKSFGTALDQWVALGADASFIYASTVSLRRARDLAER